MKLFHISDLQRLSDLVMSKWWSAYSNSKGKLFHKSNGFSPIPAREFGSTGRCDWYKVLASVRECKFWPLLPSFWFWGIVRKLLSICIPSSEEKDCGDGCGGPGWPNREKLFGGVGNHALFASLSGIPLASYMGIGSLPRSWLCIGSGSNVGKGVRSFEEVEEAGDKDLSLGDTLREPAIIRGPSRAEPWLDDGGEGVDKGVSESYSRLFE